eukprot:2040821-Rhodomonas_salina.3
MASRWWWTKTSWHEIAHRCRCLSWMAVPDADRRRWWQADEKALASQISDSPAITQAQSAVSLPHQRFSLFGAGCVFLSMPASPFHTRSDEAVSYTHLTLPTICSV